MPNDPQSVAALSALGADGWRVLSVTTLSDDRGAVQVLLEREDPSAASA